jgi:hypothetical protein
VASSIVMFVGVLIAGLGGIDMTEKGNPVWLILLYMVGVSLITGYVVTHTN